MAAVPQPHWMAESPVAEEIRKHDWLAAGAEARLRQAGFIDFRRVSCRFENGVLSLHGRVPTFYLKQMAHVLVASLEGVQRICNQLDVGPIQKGTERDR